MKNLDDLLKAKAAQAETEQQTKAEQEEAEVRQSVEGELTELQSAKQQLEFIKQSLSIEETGRTSAKRGRQQAETKIDAKAADLEKVGLSKEELLSNPDYQELEEVKGVSDAAAEEEMYSTPSVGSEELNKKLSSLGVEVPEGEADERAVSRAIEARVSALDTSILETRLKIPSEREKVVSDIVSTYKLKLPNLEVGREMTSYREEGSFKDVYRQLDDKLYSVPIVNNNPELRQAVMTQVVKEALLAKNKTYQEKLGKREEYETRLKAYEDAKEKLPEYLEFLNSSFFDAISERLAKLDQGVERDLWDNSELKGLADIYDINWRERKITGLKLDKGALPSVKEMERLMNSSRKPWEDMGNLSYTLEGLERLEGVKYEDYRNRRRDVFQGNLNAIVRQLPPKETVPQKHRYTDETYQKWDAAFKKTEDRAEAQAKQFTEYVVLQQEMRTEDTSGARTEKGNIDKNLEDLRTAASRLAGSGETEFRVEGGKVINTSWEKSNNDLREEKGRIETEKTQLEVDLRNLGSKPEGLFSGKKKEAWEAEHTRISREIAKRDERIGQIDGALTANSADWTGRFNLPPELLEEMEGTTTKGGEISKVIYGEMETMQPRGEELGQVVRSSEGKRQKLTELEKRRFLEDTQSDFYDTGL